MRHRHEPVGREELVAAARAGLLLVDEEGVGVEFGSALVPELAWWTICCTKVLLSRFIISPMPDLSFIGMDIWAIAATLHNSSGKNKMRFTKTPQEEQTKTCNGIVCRCFFGQRSGGIRCVVAE